MICPFRTPILLIFSRRCTKRCAMRIVVAQDGTEFCSLAYCAGLMAQDSLDKDKINKTLRLRAVSKAS